MSVNLKRSVLAFVCGLVLTSSFVFAQSNPSSSGGINFPEVEGWEKGDVTTYPTAELGYSVAYKSPTGGVVTVYVYNGGLSNIADGIGDENVKNEIKKAENDIKAYGEAGYYQNVSLIKSETVTLGGTGATTKALYSLFSFKIKDAEVDSEVYVLGYQNNFIKIRTTRLKGKNGADNPEVNKLLAEIGRLFLK